MPPEGLKPPDEQRLQPALLPQQRKCSAIWKMRCECDVQALVFPFECRVNMKCKGRREEQV